MAVNHPDDLVERTGGRIVLVVLDGRGARSWRRRLRPISTESHAMQHWVCISLRASASRRVAGLVTSPFSGTIQSAGISGAAC
jgi:hypothetical protein